ncbi:MAG TPA: LPS assembly protein LptD [Geobacteraceae bacterium]|nr:LPS assembly protein LptD [Geobacteraceae bacterium]
MGQSLIKTCLAALFLVATPFVSIAAEGVPASGEVKVKADTISYDKEQDLLRADGAVELRWDNCILHSDSARLRQGVNEAVAEGKVSLVRNGDVLNCSRIRLNYQSELGEADNCDLFVKQRNFHLYGDSFIKTGAENYRLERGSFTTCDGPTPSWKFTATNLDVTVEDYARGRNAVFYVGNIPIFYTPYIAFPVRRERQSGFLIPRIGSSNIKGFYLDIPYYWAITPSQDLTVDLDGQTKRGAGVGIDYRYMRPKGSDGSFKGYFIYDTEQERERGYGAFKEREFISPTLSLISDVNVTLDRGFFRDYGEENGDYNRQLLDSTVFLTKNWGANSFTPDVRYITNIDLGAPSNRGTLQKLPTLTFTRVQSPLGPLPLFAGLDSSFTNFYRNEGIQGQRLDLHPTLSLYRTIPGGIDLSATGGYRQRVYNAYGGDSGNGYHDDGIFDANVSASSSLARVYRMGSGNLEAVRHTIIPELGYNVVQLKNQDRLPFFDFDDRVVGQQMVTWSLSNYVTGKYVDPVAPPNYRDLLFLRLSEGYQLSGTRNDLLTLVDEKRRFTDIRLEARFAPVKILSITTDSRYNPYQTRFSTATAGFNLDDTKGNLAGLSYHFARDQVDYLEGNTALSLVKPFVFKYTFRYSIDKGGFLESLYSAEYKRQCWSVIFTYHERLLDRAFMVSFTLAGVGAVGPMKAF